MDNGTQENNQSKMIDVWLSHMVERMQLSEDGRVYTDAHTFMTGDTEITLPDGRIVTLNALIDSEIPDDWKGLGDEKP